MRHLAIATLIFGCVIAAPALAAPPTVTPSPGYDRRLEESRRQSVAPAPSEWRDTRPARRPRKHKPPH